MVMPHCNGTLLQLHCESYKGGCLIALSKAPKPGVLSINIGDTDDSVDMLTTKLSKLQHNTSKWSHV